MELIFATHNLEKLKEIQNLIGSNIKILSLNDIGYSREINETGQTFEENAFIKANTIYQIYNKPVFADDSGLEVKALNGRPGVFSARFAGEGYNSFDPHIKKLLDELKGIKQREARFRTVICLIINDKVNFFEGIINGHIAEYQSGVNGFGYDPIFIPNGYSKTFAEMNIYEKNKISHRAKAVSKLIKFIMSDPHLF
ncbi:MAG: RdgB/HAM1 family non-canonical purine NTP pyrophosphatase [Bacteroidales bacterium]|jgi:XTP/dITP diphosphohydrolase|nr:RdgB/HAM1 family non-canonical purine NTP pyrophosphatase [Bacteroidales bacterium]MDI9576423.1 RdgB/HAM1 family non-canonical purine NTP pyrophosphatase [Bacteroidota bacterium]MDD2593262.1 RdgB/HAM1 family non-canonical purine NTP pyrophosphatase [Bacteroidales bacterium]MDD3754848.1 RdgB/HAM1 family non-canonical purine NTP pyrophosphatase [Bacteroidales bacterium]MDY0400112.1 RdgB/HAM1 family non-canonical purine NTP pyrophosphatase [Bacteroidales bacterium]